MSHELNHAMNPIALPLTGQAALAHMRQWAGSGWLRHLDHALAAFMLELDRNASAPVLVATALLAHMEGRGHTCLPLNALAATATSFQDSQGRTGWQMWLDWPAAAQPALHALVSQLPTDADAWAAALCASAVVRNLATAPDVGQPLVLAGPAGEQRLYLRRYWDLERNVANHMLRLSQEPPPALADDETVHHWLGRLFDQTPPTPADVMAPLPNSTSTGVDWQKLACALAATGRLSIITGGPGTGKTYTAARLLALLLALSPGTHTLRVALAAPTGKAAARLRQSLVSSLADLGQRLGPGVDTAGFVQRLGAATTLHALLGTRPGNRQFVHHAGHPLALDVLVVDEASMVHLDMMAAVLDALPPGARLVLMGDKDQLASVEAGAVLGELCRHAELPGYSAATVQQAQALTGQRLDAWQCPPGSAPQPVAQRTVMLRESRRFSGPIGQLALAVNAGQPAQALHTLQTDATGAVWAALAAAPADVVHLAVHGRPGSDACYAACFALLAQRPVETGLGSGEDDHNAWVHRMLSAFDRFRLLCAVREGPWGVAGLNTAIEQALASAHLLRPSALWYPGRPVMVTRNDAALGVFNGDIGLTLPAPGPAGGLRVYFRNGDELRSVGVNRLPQVETALAMTVHKSQGSEFEHTALVLPAHAPQVFSRQLLYTGITRARQHLSLLAPSAEVLEQGVLREVSRWGGLGSLLDASARPCA